VPLIARHGWWYHATPSPSYPVVDALLHSIDTTSIRSADPCHAYVLILHIILGFTTGGSIYSGGKQLGIV
jgi:hypothetical protein